MEARLRQNEAVESLETDVTAAVLIGIPGDNRTKPKDLPIRNRPGVGAKKPAVAKQVLGRCERCGYMSSQAICHACVLLEGLNKNRPQIQI